MILETYLERQREWSRKVFGSGKRTLGLLQHIEKEIVEVKQNPEDVMEWVDIIILALDGAWRAGYTPEQVVKSLSKKQAINFARTWPTPISEDKAVEHVRSEIHTEQLLI